ncbi:MAG: glycosyltransferase family 4 protein [Sedimentisphaerales bacterium]|nr:glycosyltransferase family 4 protein [Sedimentisphaerales bacterium]
MTNTHKLTICFTALNAYNVLSGRGDLSHTGGAEVQQLLIAKWLVGRGFPVSFITLDHGQTDGIEIDGIKVYKAYAPNDGIRGLRFIHPRWSGLWSAMSRANSDVYYQRTADCQTGQVGLWCRLHHKKFIFAAANESDCVSSLYALKNNREKILYKIGLKYSNIVIAQTITQQKLLRENMKVDSYIVPNCRNDSIEGLLDKELSIEKSKALRVLWIGRINEQKRFEWLLDIAEQCADITFDVVGAANVDSDYSNGLVQRAAKIPNVKMHGYVPYSEIGKYYQQCDILCCTSAYEGFPNTFLEAWAIGMPVVTTFDPDGVVSANNLGWIAQDVEGIVKTLQRIIQSPEIWKKASTSARQYYLANHTPEVCLPKFEKLLIKLFEDKVN